MNTEKIFSKLFLTSVVALIISCDIFAQNSNVVHLKVKRLNDSFIDAFYNKPESKKKKPLLIFCQGSGYDSNSEGFLGLMNKFSKQAVGLVIEKQGVNFGDKGDSLRIEYTSNNLVQNRLSDYFRVLQHLRTEASWWNGDIYVIGGSEGGLLAGMLASYYPTTKGVAIFSFGGGLNFGEAWPLSIGLQEQLKGTNEQEIQEKISKTKDTLSYIRENPTTLKSYEGKDNTYAWWASIIDLRLENVLLDLTIPIYLVQGTADIMAPPISARKLNEDFIAKGKKNLFYKELDGYDHVYIDKAGNSHLVEVIYELLEQLLKTK
jgi:pimeloyl-ACP methyl ester carboxylesterase